MLQLLQNVPVYSTVCNPGVQSLSGQLPAAEVEGSSQGSVCSLYGFLKVWFLIVRSSVFQIKETAELLPLGLATTASALGLQLILLLQMCRLPAMAFGGPCTWRLGQVSTWSLAMLNCFQRKPSLVSQTSPPVARFRIAHYHATALPHGNFTPFEFPSSTAGLD